MFILAHISGISQLISMISLDRWYYSVISRSYGRGLIMGSKAI